MVSSSFNDSVKDKSMFCVYLSCTNTFVISLYAYFNVLLPVFVQGQKNIVDYYCCVFNNCCFVFVFLLLFLTDCTWISIQYQPSFFYRALAVSVVEITEGCPSTLWCTRSYKVKLITKLNLLLSNIAL